MNDRLIWYRTRLRVPGTPPAIRAGCRCPVQPAAESWRQQTQDRYHIRTSAAAIRVRVSPACPLHRDTPDTQPGL